MSFLLVVATTYDLIADELVVADLVGNVAIVLLAWIAGRLVRVSTDRRVTAELGRERAASEAAAAERSSIARDLHDSVAHALTLITLQAGGAREQATDLAVATQFRVIDRIRSVGVAVTVSCDVDSNALPPSVSATAYRVVQEALTNAVKHADGAVVSVVVRADRMALDVEVCDGGGIGQPAVSGSGRGLVGLRERLALFDGTLRAGTIEGAGWQVAVRIPLARTP